MTLETEGIFPLRFYLFILYFVYVLAFVSKPIVDAKGEGETLLLMMMMMVIMQGETTN